MRITIICDVLGEANNGTTIAAFNLIHYLREKGHAVTVVAPEGGGDGIVSVPALNLGSFLNNILHRNGVQLARPDRDILEDAIKDADVVHLLLPFLLSAHAIPIAQKYGKPITASFHCQAENFTAHLGMMNVKWLNYLTYKVFYRFVYSRCTAVHYPTQFIRDVFEGCTHETNAYVISNGVNDRFVQPAVRAGVTNDPFTIVCCGRYSREKAQQQLIRAVAQLPQKEHIRIVFAGDGPRKQYLLSLAEQFGVNCQFRFFSRSELIELLQSADLYVHTAMIEIEAIACMEAICCGLVPVICNSDRSATRFFALGEKTLFEPDHPTDLACKIDYWYRHPEEKERKSGEYQTMRSRFSQRKCMEKMEEMLYEATEIHEENILLPRSAQ